MMYTVTFRFFFYFSA
ncbi:pheST operon leader peptide PheM [Yersinia mollaretii]|uniref:pheST attenuator peptide n=1 Tax=Yersinia mollaretii TaxID=33060 RepID=A0AA44HXY4_YERMO|nr:pheST operon leader peptide PheM [Yersinia mollaretii]